MSGDEAMRSYAATLPAPEFTNPAYATPPPLADATVAIVTSAALHRPDAAGFTQGDTSYRVIDRHDRDLVLGHWSPNFDRSGFSFDLNVVFPIDRLEELSEREVIGDVAPLHLSFAGNQPDDLATVIHDSGPAAASRLREAGVDVVLLTPV